MSEVHEGGCLCGGVRYRLTGKEKWAAVCHCTFCQKRTGSAFGVAVYADASRVEFIGGEMQSYSYRSDESGRWVKTEFCARCGTTLTWTAEFFPGLRGLAGGTFDDPNWFAIRLHVWTRSAQHWMVYPAGMRVERTAP